MNLNALVYRPVKGMSIILTMALALSLVLGLGLVAVAHAATFTVNSPGDEPDLNPGDGRVPLPSVVVVK